MTEVVSHISFSWIAGYLESILFPLTIFKTAITTFNPIEISLYIEFQHSRLLLQVSTKKNNYSLILFL